MVVQQNLFTLLKFNPFRYHRTISWNKTYIYVYIKDAINIAINSVIASHTVTSFYIVHPRKSL